MSRTDVHRPAWVQRTDPADRHRFSRPAHNHWEVDCWDRETGRWLVRRSRPCDAHDPAVPEVDRRCVRWPHFQWCGCPLCSGSLNHRLSHRHQRTSLRALLRELTTAAADDLDTIDTAAGHRPRWVSGARKSRHEESAEARRELRRQ